MKKIGANDAVRNFNITKTTPISKLKNNQHEKADCIGPEIAFAALERKLASHIKNLQATGLAAIREVRVMAYNLVVQRKFVNTIFYQKLVPPKKLRKIKHSLRYCTRRRTF